MVRGAHKSAADIPRRRSLGYAYALEINIRCPCENTGFGHLTHHHPRRTRTMDIERINLIGTTLADLSSRTQELRGYL